MFTHENLWVAIDRLASSSGYSTSGLAKKAGLDPTSFNKSKRMGPDGRPRWPSTESLSRILAATGSTMADFICLIEETTVSVTTQDSESAQMIPVIGYAQAGKDGYFDDAGYPAGDGWDMIRFPGTDAPASGNLYALEVSGDSMEPLYREGDRLIVAPGGPVRRGDRVIVKTTNGEVMAKELIRQTAGKIELASLNPHYATRSLAMSEISWIARVLWVSQ
jgi:phage repressor protein C with HTH and peptisase S24 domain